MNITNYNDEQAAHKLADALLHNCRSREMAIEVDGKAMWECWTCGKRRKVLAGRDAEAWFNDAAHREAASILRAKGL